MLVINPEECIDCHLCVAECPVEAIYPEDEVPEDQQAFIALNAELSQKWPVLNMKKESFSDAKDWEGKLNKQSLLET
jgi:ferredoxin